MALDPSADLEGIEHFPLAQLRQRSAEASPGLLDFGEDRLDFRIFYERFFSHSASRFKSARLALRKPPMLRILFRASAKITSPQTR